MDSQPEINQRMRAIIVDWLIEVHQKNCAKSRDSYRYLVVTTTSRRELQLGISAMLIASKYEEIWAPEVKRRLCVHLRQRLHSSAGYGNGIPTPYVRFIKVAVSDAQVTANVKY
ncbi:hypothetical protein RND71_015406 [Anisodus tanguticus]|uniref:Cyclin N-terminal domain-containing protein n=1 Tax=Anisodus tanguticus TaxID=243964 RepID=A0AAE1S5L4_9SOLA|nr:hypothetical protein RND71_015406 [Anisodus tanguticus]